MARLKIQQKYTYVEHCSGCVYNSNMTVNWLALSAIGTLTLAAAAFVTVYMNYRWRKGDSERNAKLQVLDEIRDWAFEIHSTESLAVIGDKRESDEAERRIPRLMSQGLLICQGATVLGKELVEKAEKASDSIDYINQLLFGKPIAKEVSQEEFFNALVDLLVAVSEYKLKLLTSTKIIKQPVTKGE